MIGMNEVFGNGHSMKVLIVGQLIEEWSTSRWRLVSANEKSLGQPVARDARLNTR